MANSDDMRKLFIVIRDLLESDGAGPKTLAKWTVCSNILMGLLTGKNREYWLEQLDRAERSAK